MDITVNSFVQNVLSPCFGPAKPKVEDYDTNSAWRAKENTFRYNVAVVIIDGALVAAIASIALAVFGVIGPVLALTLLGASALTYWNGMEGMKEISQCFDGLKRYDLEDWEGTAFVICDLIGWLSLLPSPKKT